MVKPKVCSIFLLLSFHSFLSSMESNSPNFFGSNLHVSLPARDSFTTISDKSAVLVLGAPRSGTSATTGLLQIAGLNLGDNLSEPRSWNPKGDFEDKSTIILNRTLIRSLGISHYEKKQPNIDWHNASKAIRAKNDIKMNLEKNFGHMNIFGLKHPRVCLLLPLYIQALEELDYTIKIVIVRRDTKDIIRSLNKTEKQQNNILSEEKGTIFVSNFLNPIFEHTQGYESVEIAFGDAINYPERVIEKVRPLVPTLYSYDRVKTDVNNFLGINKI